ncbi:MAG: hypothetical protein H6728_07425 [Myxococcales bacterium]|nr:hypothetical protein [Myxococcales bacterium]
MNTYAPQSPMFSPFMQNTQESSYAETQDALEVRLSWGDRLLEHTHFYRPKKITLGGSRRDTFTLETSDLLPAGCTSFTLVETQKNQMMVHFTHQMDGAAWIKDRWYTLEQLKQSPKTERNRARLQVPAAHTVQAPPEPWADGVDLGHRVRPQATRHGLVQASGYSDGKGLCDLFLAPQLGSDVYVAF